LRIWLPAGGLTPRSKTEPRPWDALAIVMKERQIQHGIRYYFASPLLYTSERLPKSCGTPFAVT